MTLHGDIPYCASMARMAAVLAQKLQRSPVSTFRVAAIEETGECDGMEPKAYPAIGSNTVIVYLTKCKRLS